MAWLGACRHAASLSLAILLTGSAPAGTAAEQALGQDSADGHQTDKATPARVKGYIPSGKDKGIGMVTGTGTGIEPGVPEAGIVSAGGRTPPVGRGTGKKTPAKTGRGRGPP